MYSYIEDVAGNQAIIKVLGIGGAGCNAIERMLSKHIQGVDLIACNTDVLSLQKYHAPTCLQLGKNITNGWGAGGKPSVGRSAALEDEDMIRTHLNGADMLFITAGMGGGTGTGGAPIVAEIARDMGILTVAVVTTPFHFEGHKRIEEAKGGIADIEPLVDTLIVVPNERILSVIEPGTSLVDAFLKADEILSNAVQGISDLIIHTGTVNVDFADVKTVMTSKGKAFFGTGIGHGENHVFDAVESAIKSDLLDNFGIDGARNVLVNFTSGDNLCTHQLSAACKKINEVLDKNVLIIFGHVYEPEYCDKTKVTIIATGYDNSNLSRNKSEERYFETLELFTSKTGKPSAKTKTAVEHPDNVEQDDESIVDIEIDLNHNVNNTACIQETNEIHLANKNEIPESSSRTSANLNPQKSSPGKDYNDCKPAQRIAHTETSRTLKEIPFVKKQSENRKTPINSLKLEGIAKQMYSDDINTPAFLRRKAD